MGLGLKERDLLELLQTSSEVQRVIRNIVSTMPDFQKNKISPLEEKIKDLQYQLNSKNTQLQKIQRDYSDMQQKNQMLQNDISEKQQSLQKLSDDNRKLHEQISDLQNDLNESSKKINILKNVFGEPVRYLNLYKSLSESTKTSLYNVVNDHDTVSFIVSCTTEDNLKAIWDYTREIIDLPKYSEDADILKQIFDYFFRIFNDSLPEAVYIRDVIEEGTDFDDEYYDRASGSATYGSVQSVLLLGYQSRNTGKIIRKSLVKV